MYQHNLILQLLQPELMIPVEYFFTCNTINKNFQYLEKTWQNLSKKSMGIILVTTIRLHIPSVTMNCSFQQRLLQEKKHYVNQQATSPQTFRMPHSISRTSHITNISCPRHLTSQLSHILNIPHLQHPIFRISYISKIPHSHIPNIPPQYPTSPNPTPPTYHVPNF